VTARRLSTIFLLLTVGFALTAIGIRVFGTSGDGMSKKTLVLIFPVFLGLMTRKTARYPRIGALVCFIAMVLALAGLNLALNAQ